jgi:DNA-binding HxlR family transcriptional regulator
VGTIERREKLIATALLAAHGRLRHKWAIQALYELYDARPQPLRFGDLVGALGALGNGTVWQNTLRQTLDHLRSYGLVVRELDNPRAGLHHQSASHIYTLTMLGGELVELLKPVGQWVHDNWPELEVDPRYGEVDRISPHQAP